MSNIYFLSSTLLRKFNFFYIVLLLITCTARAQIISTVAGIGYPGYSGDAGAATAAQLSYPEAAAVDMFGNLYVGHSNKVIRKVDVFGMITTFAGTGALGYGGDGGPATLAKLNSIKGITTDKRGNVFVFDGNRIRKIDAGGVISTVAGDGSSGVSGDGGPATLAGIGTGYGLCLDDTGNIYIAAMQRIRKVDTFGIIHAFAGTGAAGYSLDGSRADTARVFGYAPIAMDVANNLYYIDNGYGGVRRINTAGIIKTIAGNGTGGSTGDGGPATAAELDNPYGIAIDACGNVYISDGSNNNVRKVDASSGTINRFAGSGFAGYFGDGGPATSADLNEPHHICLDTSNNLYIVERLNHVVRRVTPAPPHATTITGTDTVCAGTSLTLTAAATAGVWVSSSAATATAAAIGAGGSAAISGIASGLVTVTYMGTLSCARDTVRYTIWVKSATDCIDHTAVVPAHGGQGISVVPNPSKGVFTLYLSSATNEQVKVMVTDLTGRTIKELNITTNKPNEITLNAAPGVYYINAGVQRTMVVVE